MAHEHGGTPATVEPAAPVPAKVNEWEWETPLGVVKLGVDTVRRYFCAKASDQEIMHFLAVCKYHQLNPWLREAYLIKYQDGEPAQIAIGRDTHAIRAEDHPMYAGSTGGIIVKREDGTVEEREGEFYLPPDVLVGGWAKVLRTDRKEPIVHRIRLADWDAGRAFWKKSPAHMIAKTAMSQCLHLSFPRKYEGLMSEDEADASRGVLTAREIALPLSNAEAKEVEAKAELLQETGQVLEAMLEDVAGDPAADDPALAAEAAAREQAEAQAEQGQIPMPTPKVDRAKVWKAVKDRAMATGKPVNVLLRAMTGKSNMPDLTDAEVADLAKKLEG